MIHSIQLHFAESGGVGCLKQPKLGSPATSSQPNSNENFPMPRLASPAILPSIHRFDLIIFLYSFQKLICMNRFHIFTSKQRS